MNKYSFEFKEQYSQFFTKCNWYDFTFICLDIETIDDVVCIEGWLFGFGLIITRKYKVGCEG